MGPGEQVLTDLEAHGWRYYGYDSPTYERRTALIGGPIMMLVSAIASCIGNRRARRAAEQTVGPHWLPLGPLRILVTTSRLRVWFDNGWHSVWFGSLVNWELEGTRLDLYFAHDPSYRLFGDDVTSLATMLPRIARPGERAGTVHASS